MTAAVQQPYPGTNPIASWTATNRSRDGNLMLTRYYTD
jgi:hypothetical protein